LTAPPKQVLVIDATGYNPQKLKYSTSIVFIAKLLVKAVGLFGKFSQDVVASPQYRVTMNEIYTFIVYGNRSFIDTAKNLYGFFRIYLFV
jgi:hypothetical protein